MDFDPLAIRAALRGRRGWILKAIVAATRRDRPPEAGLPVPAIPPCGPLPKQGGAEAALEFDD
jgi:hypothetical protein